MTDGLDQALASAGLALIAADPIPAPAMLLFDGFVPAGPGGIAIPPPYVLVYTTVDRPSADPDNSADGKTRVWVARWYCHCVGATASSARAMAQRVRTQLLDVRPTVAGFAASAVGPIRWEQSQPPQRDETTGTLVMDAVEVYALRATN